MRDTRHKMGCYVWSGGECICPYRWGLSVNDDIGGHDMKEHHLKIDPEHLCDLELGEKTYELRERRDRDFQVGDVLVFTHDRNDFRYLITHIGTLDRVAEATGACGDCLSDWNILSVQKVVF